MGKRGLLREDCCVIDTRNRLMMLKMGSCCSVSERRVFAGEVFAGEGFEDGNDEKKWVAKTVLQ